VQREALAAVAEAKGRVLKSELKQHSAGQFSAVLQFEVAPEAAGPLRDRLKQLGNMVRLEIDRVQQAEGGTAPAPRDAKVKRGDTHFDLRMYNLARVEPRETATVRLAVADVTAAYRTLREAVEKAKGRVVTAHLNEHDRQNVTAQFDFELRRGDERDILAALAAAGDVLSREVNRAPDGPNLTDAKVLFKASLTSAAALLPRETVKLGIEAPDVDATAALLAAQVADVQGRTVVSQVNHDGSGRVTGHLVYDVPLSAAPGLVDRFKGAGTVRVHETNRQPQADEGKLATARIDVTVSNAELIVSGNDGLWPQVRKGLSYSVAVLSLSVTWLIFGLCVVLPWALVGYGGYRLVRRLFRAPPAPTAPA
jgi:glycine cleavage system regulatory protein